MASSLFLQLNGGYSTPGPLGIGTTPPAGKTLGVDGTLGVTGAVSITAGSGTATGRPELTLDLKAGVPYAQTGADTNETTLWSYTLPANTLNAANTGLVLEISGYLANNGNAKTVQVYVGTAAYYILNAGTIQNGYFTARLLVVRTTSAADQLITRLYGMANSVAGTVLQPAGGSYTQNLAADCVIKVTGTNGTASAGDVQLYSARLVFL